MSQRPSSGQEGPQSSGQTTVKEMVAESIPSRFHFLPNKMTSPLSTSRPSVLSHKLGLIIPAFPGFSEMKVSMTVLSGDWVDGRGKAGAPDGFSVALRPELM